jgi:hypothetical protein
MAGATTQSSTSNNVTVTEAGTVTKPSNSVGIEYTKQVIPNILDSFASYAYNLSLSVLDDDSFNNATYKKSGAKGPFLAYSAHKDPNNRVNTVFGKFDFFIEDLRINHLIGFEKSSGNTNALGMSFKILEPYSMGLFFVALQQDALAKGHLNYLDAPLLLTLEFRGHISPEAPFINIPFTTRHFPIKLRLLEMKVNHTGCYYEISAYPANESALEKSKITLTTALSIKGNTVEKMLKTEPEKSLEVYLNAKVKDQKTGELVKKTDEYVIEFPDLPDGTPNPIKSVDMGFDLYKGTNTPFAKDNLVYENGIYKRGNIEINPKVSEFKFGQGTDILTVINQVIMMSEYGRTALKSVSADGFVNWWRIEPNLNYISSDENLDKTGVKPKRYIYRIVPYRVSSSYFLPPNEKLKGGDLDKKLVLKEYNYIYSGKNVEIIDFDINFKAGFYTAIAADGNQNTDDKKLQDQTGKAVDPNAVKDGRQTVDGQTVVSKGANPTKQEYSRTNLGPSVGKDDPASLAAKQFHEALTSGVDMINVGMTILGDPFYIGDSGIGNYHAGPSDNKYANSDGAMSWDTGEIHITLNFKTPVDIDLSTGLYDFSRVYNVLQFSGLYRILKADSIFSRGKFTQELKMLRLKGQEVEEGSGKLAVAPAEVEPSSSALINEDGSVSNFRRNEETGELYDATGLYDSQGRPLF